MGVLICLKVWVYHEIQGVEKNCNAISSTSGTSCSYLNISCLWRQILDSVPFPGSSPGILTIKGVYTMSVCDTITYRRNLSSVDSCNHELPEMQRPSLSWILQCPPTAGIYSTDLLVSVLKCPHGDTVGVSYARRKTKRFAP